MNELSQVPSLDYALCRYGASKLVFRGPKKGTTRPYMAFIGGTEFYGKFVRRPIPALVEEQLGIPCLNLGCTNAGVDVFSKDPTIIDLANGAQVAVVQITGAQNLTNRFYKVHPRRNDRFVAPSELLRAVFPEVDFTTVHFTRHALQELARVSPTRFRVLIDELKSAWLSRMIELLNKISVPTVLFWMGVKPLDEEQPDTTRNPLFVDRTMIDRLSSKVDQIIECVVSEDVKDEASSSLHYTKHEETAARHMFGAFAHKEGADVLVDGLREYVPERSVKARLKGA